MRQSWCIVYEGVFDRLQHVRVLLALYTIHVSRETVGVHRVTAVGDDGWQGLLRIFWVPSRVVTKLHFSIDGLLGHVLLWILCPQVIHWSTKKVERLWWTFCQKWQRSQNPFVEGPTGLNREYLCGMALGGAPEYHESKQELRCLHERLVPSP